MSRQLRDYPESAAGLGRFAQGTTSTSRRERLANGVSAAQEDLLEPLAKGSTEADLVVASSLAPVVEMWLRLYEDGAHYFNDDEARWEADNMPEWSRRAGADGLV